MSAVDPTISARIDAYVDSLDVDSWPLPSAAQLDVLRRVFTTSKTTADDTADAA